MQIRGRKETHPYCQVVVENIREVLGNGAEDSYLSLGTSRHLTVSVGRALALMIAFD